MAELFLHIGAPKTGTTAIQHALSTHRESLAEQGVLYPRSGLMGHGHHRIGAAIYLPRRRKLGRVRPEEVLAEDIPGITAEIESSGAHRVILSTEYLWAEVPKARVLRLLEPFARHSLNVVAYVRRQDLLAQSIYTQAIKKGAVRSFADWLDAEGESARAGLHFDRVLASWSACGLPVTMHVRVYERGQIASDVVEDFLGVVCPEVVLEQRGRSGGVNTSPDHVTTELIRRVSARTDDKAIAERLRRLILTAAPPRESFSPIEYFPGDAAVEFLARFAEGNVRVARDYLGRADGVLFRDPPPGPGKAITPNAMLERLIRLMPELLRIPPAAALPDEDDDAPAPARPAAARAQPTPEQLERRRKRRAEREAALRGERSLGA